MFRAYDPERDALVAVKLFKLNLPPERAHQLVAQFEHLIGLSVSHEAIASPIATGLVEASAYLAQQFVSAESLDLAIRQYGPAPVDDALRVAAQLAGALDFAAVVNVHHGALHPRDVLLSADETKLTGLGVAHALEQVGASVPQRRPYSAPERVAGADWDRRADVFSLGALIYELLWGRRIAGIGARAVESLTAIEGGDLPALRSVFARALAEKPAARFSTALEFAEALTLAFPTLSAAPLHAAAPPLRAPEPAPPPIDARLPLDDLERETPDAVTVGDFDLKAAEEERYADVAVAPAIVTAELSTTEDTEHTEERKGHSSPRHDFSSNSSVSSASSVSSVSSVVERLPSANVPATRSPSRTWPLFMMLLFGVVAGLAAGYVMWSRPEAVAPQQSAASTAPKPATPSGREFTESSVPEPPKTPPAPAPEVAAPKPAAGPGRLLVRSTPAGAAVFVDGKEQGQTPVAVRDLAPGAHDVRLERDGYAPVERRIVITASQPAQSLIIPLSEARAVASGGTRSGNPVPTTPATLGRYSGALDVDSRPTGAKVYLDNKLVGTTPLRVPNLAAGSHAIRLERDGYRRWSSSIRVVAAERNRVTASLER